MIIFEPQCIGYEHAEVNAAYILLISKAFPDERIVFFGEKKHLELVRGELAYSSSADVQYCVIEVPRLNQSYLRRLTIELFNIRYIFLVAKRQNTNIFLLSITSASLLASKIFGFGLRFKIYIVVHGILETINRRPNSLLAKLFWFRRYFINGNFNNLKYILNSKFVEMNVLALFPLLKDHIRSIELPYIFENYDRKEYNNPVDTVLFSGAGVAAVSKGSHLFFKLAKDVLSRKNLQNIKFMYIGHFVDKKMEMYINECVQVPSKDKPLDKSVYQTNIMKTDFLVFFYPKDLYNFTVSGVFYDAIRFEKPIIAIKTDFFSYYFDKYGDLGWLCEDYNEVVNLVEELSKSINFDKLKQISLNYRKLKEDLSINSQISKAREVIRRC
jgi:hypothetical protein